MGRGAVLAYSEETGSGSAPPPAAFVKAGDWEERTPDSSDDLSSLREIMSRVTTYDPESEFVVVYRAEGLMGCDVVKPSMKPREVAEEIRNEREKRQSKGEGGWGGGVGGKDTTGYIDV